MCGRVGTLKTMKIGTFVSTKFQKECSFCQWKIVDNALFFLGHLKSLFYLLQAVTVSEKHHSSVQKISVKFLSLQRLSSGEGVGKERLCERERCSYLKQLISPSLETTGSHHTLWPNTHWTLTIFPAQKRCDICVCVCVSYLNYV